MPLQPKELWFGAIDKPSSAVHNLNVHLDKGSAILPSKCMFPRVVSAVRQNNGEIDVRIAGVAEHNAVRERTRLKIASVG